MAKKKSESVGKVVYVRFAVELNSVDLKSLKRLEADVKSVVRDVSKKAFDYHFSQHAKMKCLKFEDTMTK